MRGSRARIPPMGVFVSSLGVFVPSLAIFVISRSWVLWMRKFVVPLTVYGHFQKRETTERRIGSSLALDVTLLAASTMQRQQ
ncbi:hypothetical protein C8J56DRAFT_913519 [Mycena floridula]|nr:hypothetical protein C8J56DRAFT_913519 [Mycena floridula]